MAYGPTVVATTRVRWASAFSAVGVVGVGDDQGEIGSGGTQIGASGCQLLEGTATEADLRAFGSMFDEVVGEKLTDEAARSVDDDVEFLGRARFQSWSQPTNEHPKVM